ncbi:hypothetical protein FRB99_002952 [Tulasnella sp. 403]|nr:hypothetical protein FRB99_002952 [Tulasnella sp. 403]
MPITIHIASHPANPYGPPVPSPKSPQQLLNGLGREFACVEGGVIQDCVPENDLEYLTPHRNGFVRAILDAYAGHHHVVLRPDDVWIAILSQFKYYLQAHPQVAKQHFLPDHPEEGARKAHQVYALGSSGSINVAAVANQMTRELQAQVADSSFRDFILPSFSTTSVDDKVVCAIMMLSCMDSFFDVSVSLMCGIPSLTLLGTESDWSAMLERVQPIADGKYGNEARHWGQTLSIILQKFVSAYENGSHATEWRGGEDREFWESIVRFSRSAGEDGQGLIGGWITAFARWSPSAPPSLPPSPTGAPLSAGAVRSPAVEHPNLRPKPISELAQYDVQVLPDTQQSISSPPSPPSPAPHYVYKSLKFPTLHPSKIPSALGVLSFPLSDNGREAPARLLAGHVGKTWFGMNADTVQPCPCWLLYIPGVNSETPEGSVLPAAVPPVPSGSATEKMKRAVTVMMRTRKKSNAANVPGHSPQASVTSPGTVVPPVPPIPPSSTPPIKTPVLGEEGGEKESRWKRMFAHARKYSEKHTSSANQEPDGDKEKTSK